MRTHFSEWSNNTYIIYYFNRTPFNVEMHMTERALGQRSMHFGLIVYCRYGALSLVRKWHEKRKPTLFFRNRNIAIHFFY